MFRSLLGSVLCLGLFACGGSQPASSPAPAPSAAPPPATASATPAPAPVEKKPTVEEQHDPIVSACKGDGMPGEYCECAFDLFKVVFKDVDVSTVAKGDPRLEKWQQQTVGVCSDKLTEPFVKQNFVEGCAEGDKSKSPYCECAWASLRKSLDYKQLMNDAALTGESGVTLRKGMAKDCKGKYPVEVAKQDFLQGCAAAKQEERLCVCRWDKLKKQVSAEEIMLGVADLANVKGLKDCK